MAAQTNVLHNIQLSTQCAYSLGQKSFLQVCQLYGLLSIPANQETLLFFATHLVDVKSLQHRIVLSYLYAVRALHIDSGPPDLPKDALQLLKGLRAICLQSQGGTQKLAMMYELLLLMKPFHNLAIPVQQVLCMALSMLYFRLLHTMEYTIHNKAIYI